jgi:hypothetical protein
MRCPYCNSTKVEATTKIKFKTEDVNALQCGACGKEVRQFGGMLPCINDFIRVFQARSMDQNIGKVKIGERVLPIDEAGIYQNRMLVNDLPANHVANIGYYYVDIFKLNDVLNKEFCS